MKCSLGISNFLEEISSLSHSIVFLYFFALIPEEGFLISPCHSLELCTQMGISFLFTSLLFTAICKACSDSHFAFLHFFFLGLVLIPVSCTMPQTSVHSSSGILSIRANPFISFDNCKHRQGQHPNLDMEHFHHSIKSSHTWEAIFTIEKQQRLVTLAWTQTLNVFVIFNLYYFTNTFSFLPLILKYRALSYAQIYESHEEQEPDLPVRLESSNLCRTWEHLLSGQCGKKMKMFGVLIILYLMKAQGCYWVFWNARAPYWLFSINTSCGGGTSLFLAQQSFPRAQLNLG